MGLCYIIIALASLVVSTCSVVSKTFFFYSNFKLFLNKIEKYFVYIAYLFSKIINTDSIFIIESLFVFFLC